MNKVLFVTNMLAACVSVWGTSMQGDRPSLNHKNSFLHYYSVGSSSGYSSESSDKNRNQSMSSVKRTWKFFKNASGDQLREFFNGVNNNDADKVHFLLEEFPRLIQARSRKQWTPLHIAAARGYEDVVAVLLDWGADPNAITNQFQSVLDVAVLNRQKGVIDLLIKQYRDRLDIDMQHVNGWSFLHVAKNQNYQDIVEYFLDNITDDNGWTALHMAVAEGNRDTVEVILDNGANMNTRTKAGYTPLYLAVSNESADILNLLLEKKYCDSVQIDLADHNGWTPVMLAAQYGNLEILNMLLEKKAELLKENIDGSTALTIAMLSESIIEDKDRIVIIERLLSANPKLIDYVNKNGEMARSIAIKLRDNAGQKAEQKKLDDLVRLLTRKKYW